MGIIAHTKAPLRNRLVFQLLAVFHAGGEPEFSGLPIEERVLWLPLLNAVPPSDFASSSIATPARIGEVKGRGGEECLVESKWLKLRDEDRGTANTQLDGGWRGRGGLRMTSVRCCAAVEAVVPVRGAGASSRKAMRTLSG